MSYGRNSPKSFWERYGVASIVATYALLFSLTMGVSWEGNEREEMARCAGKPNCIRGENIVFPAVFAGVAWPVYWPARWTYEIAVYINR